MWKSFGRLTVATLLSLLFSLVAPAVVLADVCPEPNDDFDRACFLPADSVVEGVIGFQDDRDFYRIEVPVAGTRVRVDLTDLPADYDLILVNASRDVLGRSVQEGLAPEELELTLQLAGNYYLVVLVDESRPFAPDRPYRLSVRFTHLPHPPTAAEPPAPAPEPAPTQSEPAPPPASTPVPPAAGPSPAPAEPAVGAQPAGEAWIGEIRFGYDGRGSGAVGSGGRLPAVGESTMYVFFRWRNLSPGAVRFELRTDRAAVHQETLAIGGGEGSHQLGVGRVGGPPTEQSQDCSGSFGGGCTTVDEPLTYFYEAIFLLEGKELARGWVTLGG